MIRKILTQFKKCKVFFKKYLGFTGSFLLGALAVIFILFFTLAEEIYRDQDSYDGASLPKVDAIVCLAGGRGRITHASDIWYRYFEARKSNKVEIIPTLYFAGVGQKTNATRLLPQFRIGVAHSILPAQMVIETESTNTVENAEIVFKTAIKNNWKHILIVTSKYHMRRSKFIFTRVLMQNGLKLELISSSVYQDPFDSREWRSSIDGIRLTFLEYFKWIYYNYFWDYNGVKGLP